MIVYILVNELKEKYQKQVNLIKFILKVYWFKNQVKYFWQIEIKKFSNKFNQILNVKQKLK